MQFKVRPQVNGTDVLLNGEAAAVSHTHSVPRTIAGWFLPGAFPTGTQGPVQAIDAAMTLTKVVLVGTDGKLPTGTTDVDIEWFNGSSWASIFTTRPTLATGARLGSSTALSKTSFAEDDLLRVNVIDGGGAEDVTVQVRGTVNV